MIQQKYIMLLKNNVFTKKILFWTTNGVAWEADINFGC